jgi:hypothetical protein
MMGPLLLALLQVFVKRYQIFLCLDTHSSVRPPSERFLPSVLEVLHHFSLRIETILPFFKNYNLYFKKKYLYLAHITVL